jgi:hypothetical protein
MLLLLNKLLLLSQLCLLQRKLLLLLCNRSVSLCGTGATVLRHGRNTGVSRRRGQSRRRVHSATVSGRPNGASSGRRHSRGGDRRCCHSAVCTGWMRLVRLRRGCCSGKQRTLSNRRSRSGGSSGSCSGWEHHRRRCDR